MAKEKETRKNENHEQPSAETQNTDRTIPYPRFKEVISERNNLQAEIAEREATIDNLKQSQSEFKEQIADLNKFKKELDVWKKQRHEKNVAEWDLKRKVFDVEEGDPNFEKIEKIKHRFKTGDELSPSDVAQNIEVFKTYEEINYFAQDDTKSGFSTKKPDGKPAKNTELGGYSSLDEWMRHDWQAASAWAKKNNKL